MRPNDLLEEVEISPIQRWNLYGVWPIRLIAQIMVVGTAAVHLFLVDSVLAQYSRNFNRNCYNLILNGTLQHDQLSRTGKFDFDKEDFRANHYFAFNTTDVQWQILTTVQNYFKLNDASVDFLSTAADHNDIDFPLIHYVSHDPEIEDQWHTIYSLHDLAGLSPHHSASHVSKFIHALESIDLYLAFQAHNLKQWYLSRESCVVWVYRFSYTRENFAGPFIARIQQDSAQRCPNTMSHLTVSPILLLHSWLLLVCVWHGGYAIGRVWRGVKVLWLLKQEYSLPEYQADDDSQHLSEDGDDDNDDNSSYTWNEVTYGDFLTIMNPWIILSIVGDIVLILYSSVQIVDLYSFHINVNLGDNSIGWKSSMITFLLGFGTLSHLIALNEYAEYGLVSYVFIQVNTSARLDILKLVVGAIPMLIGYVIFGLIMYGDVVSRFGTTSRSAITLFSLARGDEISDTFMDLLSCPNVSPITSVMYLLSFMVIFYIVVGMSILSVVEEVFITKGMWLLDPEEDFSSPRYQRYAASRSVTPPRNLETTPDRLYTRVLSGISLGVSRGAAHMLQSTNLEGHRLKPL